MAPASALFGRSAVPDRGSRSIPLLLMASVGQPCRLLIRCQAVHPTKQLTWLVPGWGRQQAPFMYLARFILTTIRNTYGRPPIQALLGQTSSQVPPDFRTRRSTGTNIGMTGTCALPLLPSTAQLAMRFILA